MELDDAAVAVRVAIVKLAFVDLTSNHAVTTDTVILADLVDLPKVLVITILISELHHAEAVINFNFAGVDPLLERNLFQLVPFVGTSLVPGFILLR